MQFLQFVASPNYSAELPEPMATFYEYSSSITGTGGDDTLTIKQEYDFGYLTETLSGELDVEFLLFKKAVSRTSSIRYMLNVESGELFITEFTDGQASDLAPVTATDISV